MANPLKDAAIATPTAPSTLVEIERLQVINPVNLGGGYQKTFVRERAKLSIWFDAARGIVKFEVKRPDGMHAVEWTPVSNCVSLREFNPELEALRMKQRDQQEHKNKEEIVIRNAEYKDDTVTLR